MKRPIAFAALFAILSSILGLSSAQSSVSSNPLFANNGNVTVPSGTVLIEGDIIIPEEHLYTRGTYQNWQWPGGVVYYEFAPYISQENWFRMWDAMSILQSISDVRFEQRLNNQPNYLYIIEDGANYSYVGMVRGRQELSIYNWDYEYIIVHELMHALGFWHEQSRADRDTYITINYDNIWPGYESNFNIRQGSSTYGPYDFCSVMHYGPTDFSWNNIDPTIVAKPGYEAAATCMGNRTSMTAQDQAAVASLYDASSEVPGDRPQTALQIPAIDHYTYTAQSTTFGLSTDEPVFPCSSEGRAVTNTVWFEITPDQNYYVEIYAGGYDTVLAVYTGFPESGLFMEACNDSYGTGLEEWIGLPLENGNTYFIGVGSWMESTGQLDFNMYSFRNMLGNSSFDWDTDDWNRTAVPSTRADDKLKCNRTGVFYSFCAIAFKGGVGEGSSFRQIIYPITDGYFDWGFDAGDNVWLSYTAHSKSALNKVTVKAVVIYDDGMKQKLSAPAVVGSTLGSYTMRLNGLPLAQSDLDRIIVTVTNRSGGGKTLVDNVILTGDLGANLRAKRQQSAAPTKPQTLAPVANQRGTQSSLLPVPPPAN
jgi:hypothetical protein